MRDRLLTRARFQARRLISKRRRFEELLREESQFAAIFESAAIGIVLADAEGRPHDCNPAFTRRRSPRLRPNASAKTGACSMSG